MNEKRAKILFNKKWMVKFPEKRNCRQSGEVYAKDYWAVHFVWKIFQERISKKRDQEARRLELNRIKAKKEIKRSKNNKIKGCGSCGRVTSLRLIGLPVVLTRKARDSY